MAEALKVDERKKKARHSWQELAKKPQTKAFTEKLDPESLAFFDEVCSRPFSQQAVAFLNAYWTEIGSEADFVYEVAWETMKAADMHSKGISLVFKYEETADLDFDMGLYFYEKLCKFVAEHADKWGQGKFPKSYPGEIMTATKRKAELETVDANFDRRISFLEYLLYQYREWANPGDFVHRSMGQDEHPDIKKARLALAEVNKKIQAYEAEKHRLQEDEKLGGVKGLGATNMLAQMGSSELWNALSAALIDAEAKVRIAIKKNGGGEYAKKNLADGSVPASNDGAIWWMNKNLEIAKARYGKKSKD